MKNLSQYLSLLCFCSICFTLSGAQKKIVSLHNERIKVVWKETTKGWQLSELKSADVGTKRFVSFGMPDGEYTLLYSSVAPDNKKGIDIIENGDTVRVLYKDHSQGTRPMVARRATSEVVMNRAGNAQYFYPTRAESNADGVTFYSDTKHGRYEATYSLDGDYAQNIVLTIKFTADLQGYYSLPTPSLSSISEKELKWGIVPGYFQGATIQPEFNLSYSYAQGLPRYPVLCRDNTITTLCSVISSKNGTTLGVIPSPGQARHPYTKDKSTHDGVWKVALSHMNHKSELTPTAYYPVLGEEGSFLKKGETITFSVRYALQNSDWYDLYKHAIYDVYKLKKSLEFKKTEQSLSERLLSMYSHVLNDSTSKWIVVPYKDNSLIGAQRYAGAVKGSSGDAMKNSDIAAVWMLAAMSQDKRLINDRLPYVRNFKIAQQETENEFFKGAARGQYYLWKSQEFKEEWGDLYEPMGLTYYTLQDIGNILLFDPADEQLRTALRLGADRLLEWQKPDGSFEVAYHRQTQAPVYTDIKDLRSTFYGFVIAYKILGDEKYLVAAEKSALWFIENGVNKGHFLGVCGDYRYVNDFATGQSAQALLDLYDITKNKVYLDAAVATAKMYTTSIYTHPIPSDENKFVKNKRWKDWQLSQVGMSFEHGGSVGSAVLHGPTLLASHAGLFVRMYTITADSLFIDLARAGVLGRDAFVNPDTRVASYYFTGFDQGPGPFPQHAWWQIGWIADYLVAEAEMRTNGRVSFPRGFCTPKVGPHQTVGFKNGKIDNIDVKLIIRKDLVLFDDSNVDYIAAETLDKKGLFVIVLNNQSDKCNVNADINLSCMDATNKSVIKRQLSMEPFGVDVIRVSRQP